MKVLTVFGTSPEAIKMAPVVNALKVVQGVQTEVCVTGLIRTAREVNDHKPHGVLDRAQAVLGERAACGATVACLGLAFKPDIDDLRESSVCEITRTMAHRGWRVLMVAPHVDGLDQLAGTDGMQLSPLESELCETDVLCVLVKHSEFVQQRECISRCTRVVDAVGLLA